MRQIQNIQKTIQIQFKLLQNFAEKPAAAKGQGGKAPPPAAAASTPPPAEQQQSQQKKYQYIDQETNHQMVLDLMNKKYRKLSLDSGVLRREKVVIPAEFRKATDTLVSLKKQQRCAVYIKGFEDIQDLDLTADNRQIYSIRRRLHHINQPYYFLADDQEIRCTYDHISIHPIQRWLVYAKFRRYIVGRANSIYLPFHILPTNQNNDINNGSEVNLQMEGVWVKCYNDLYPHKIVIDPIHLSRIRPLRLGDVQYLLPDGIELDQKKYLSIHQKVVTLTGDPQKRQESNIKLMQQQQANDVEITEDQGQFDEDSIKLQNASSKPKKERKNVKVKSLKKQIEAISAEVKEKLQSQFGAVKDEKKK